MFFLQPCIFQIPQALEISDHVHLLPKLHIVLNYVDDLILSYILCEWFTSSSPLHPQK